MDRLGIQLNGASLLVDLDAFDRQDKQDFSLGAGRRLGARVWADLAIAQACSHSTKRVAKTATTSCCDPVWSRCASRSDDSRPRLETPPRRPSGSHLDLLQERIADAGMQAQDVGGVESRGTACALDVSRVSSGRSPYAVGARPALTFSRRDRPWET